MITVLRTLEAQHIGMNLRQDERFLKNLSIENLYVDTLHGYRLQIDLGNGDEDGRFDGFDLQMCGLFKKQALDAHHDTILGSHILCHFLTILIIELTHQTLHHPIDIGTGLSFTENQFILRKLHRHEYAFQQIELLVGHCTVATGQLTGNVSRSNTNSSHRSL